MASPRHPKPKPILSNQATDTSMGGSEQKIDRILRAAKAEFALRGYEKASTSEICQSAGVSKGLLFHHFGTKQALYLTVYEQLIIALMARVNAVPLVAGKRYLDSIIEMSNVKLQFYSEDPEAYELMLDATFNPPQALRQPLQEALGRHVDMNKYFSTKVLEQYSFRQGVDPQKAFEILRIVADVVEHKVMSVLRSDESLQVRPKSIDRVKELRTQLLEYFDIVLYGIQPSEGAGERST